MSKACPVELIRCRPAFPSRRLAISPDRRRELACSLADANEMPATVGSCGDGSAIAEASCHHLWQPYRRAGCSSLTKGCGCEVTPAASADQVWVI